MTGGADLHAFFPSCCTGGSFTGGVVGLGWLYELWTLNEPINRINKEGDDVPRNVDRIGVNRQTISRRR